MKTVHNPRWVVATFKRPVLWSRSDDETWMLNPVSRYILNAEMLASLQEFVQSVSDLNGASLYKPLRAGAYLPGSKILVERYRERGIGDLLFMTGVMEYIRHVTGGDASIYFYALAARGQILSHHPCLYSGVTLAGPVHYDDLPLYDAHWFVDTVTEHNEEADQLNVYDSLFKSLGFNPNEVDAKFKRPSMVLKEEDSKGLDQFMFMVYMEKKLDLRKTGYYVVAPFANASLRVMPYKTWMEVIVELSNRRPVIVIGHINQRMPDAGMDAGQFNSLLDEVSRKTNVINALGKTPNIRSVASIISKANAVVCLDSGPLYVAQALRVPAVSVWGPHHPGVRIGYDQEYMDTAVWNKMACKKSPCFAYSEFPVHKCPSGESQTLCQVLLTTTSKAITSVVDEIESRKKPLSVFKAA